MALMGPRPGADPDVEEDAHRPPDARGYRWLLATLVLLLVPVAVVSVRQTTDTTEAGRIASRPPANLFAIPLEGLQLPRTAGTHRQAPSDGPLLPHGQHHNVDYVTSGGADPIRVVVEEGRVTSLADYDAAVGLRDLARFDRFSCGWIDRQGQCVALLRGGYLVTIAVEPEMPIEDLAEFSNRLYDRLPKA